jgi:hypothetical protein
MNYNYEISSTQQSKKHDHSKYIYRNNESDSNTFIFELILKDKMNQTQTIRRLKNDNQGDLITIEDGIKYNMITKYKLTALDINFPNKPIIIKESIDHSLSTNTFINDKIYLEFIQSYDNLVNISYHIISI